MWYIAPRCLPARRWVTVLVLLLGTPAAFGADAYNLATRQLTIPTIVIGPARGEVMFLGVTFAATPFGSGPGGGMILL
jgi:hypothetical protein